MNIPIYRAKTIKQDYNEWEECEQLKKIDGIWYAIGFYDCKREIKTYLGGWEVTHLILIRKSTAISEISTAETIDITTLAIHFPSMIDTKGDKIFASLQEDGKGGDILIEDGKYDDGFNPIFEPYFRKSSLSIFDLPTTPSGEYKLKWYKIIGIQK